MLKRLKTFIVQLVCKHDYRKVDNFFTKDLFIKHTIVIYKCNRCGKTLKVKIKF